MSIIVFGKEVWTTLEEKIVPQHTALLVIDVQNHLCKPGSVLIKEKGVDVFITMAILPPLAKLLDEARRVGVLVAYSRHVLRPDGALQSGPHLAWQLYRHRDSVVERGPEEGISDGMMVEGSWGAEVCEEVKPQPGDLVFSKHRQPAFIGTNLDLALRSNNIKTTIVTGIATSGCVDATVRLAYWLEYYPVVPTDGVGEMRRGWHKRGLENLLYVPPDSMTTSTDILNIWKKYPTADRTRIEVQARDHPDGTTPQRPEP